MKNIWNKVFIGLGVLIFLGSINVYMSGQGGIEGCINGIIIIIGALAYRSVSKRKNNEVKNTNLRLGIELFGMLAIVLLIVMQNNLLDRIVTHPVSYFIVPAIAIATYLIKLIKK
jgi:hypothetical protein